MVILCPSCRSKQKIDTASLVGEGLVRCSDCYNVFVVSLENLKDLWARKQQTLEEEERLRRFERQAVGSVALPAGRYGAAAVAVAFDGGTTTGDRTGFDERSQDNDVGAATILGHISPPESADEVSLPGQRSYGTLAVLDGSGKGRAIQLRKSPFVIGREGCDLNLRDIECSRRHVEITSGDPPAVRDLGSTNGSFLNGKRFSVSTLRHQDEIQVGQTRLLFFSSKPVRIAPVPAGDIPAVSDATISMSVVRNVRPAQQATLVPVCAGLEVIEGPDTGRRVSIRRSSVLIGRESPDLKLADTQVSRKHCLIEILSPGQIFVKDLASRNGTAVNGVMVKYARLAPGDRITAGDTTMVFLLEG